MSAPTGDSRVVEQMNSLLGRELGRNDKGQPYFSWVWSEDLIWPWFKTGKMLTVETEVEIPIIGGGTEKSIMQTQTPEYKPDRQVRKFDTWYIAKWMTPWELILGPGKGYQSLTHGDQQLDLKAPPECEVIAAWKSLYPGADFPSNGWKIPTDAYLPAAPEDENWARSPHGKTTPNLLDTKHFIAQVKYQTSRSADAVEKDMLDQIDAKNLRDEIDLGEQARECFPALLNPAPGKRGRASGGGFISFPYTKFDRNR